ncbi:SDR family oxidoreductase [Sphingomonas sp.]|uniref:SDR family oxidoreductase n=1 Tax=Sphingomonas sp. TaxID=28214 RepID=UPI003D6CAE9D
MNVKSLYDLSGRIAIVTGASRGLGYGIAEALGELGAGVALVARKPAELEHARDTLRAAGIEAEAFPADISRQDGIAPLVDAIFAHFGRIDILVNNAAASWGEPAESHSIDGWRKVMNVNVEAVFLLTQEVGRRAFIPQGSGRIVNVASIGGLRGNRPEQEAYTLAYNTSKGAVVNFTRALATEWGRYGIAVNALCPGFFHSKLAAGLLDRIGDQITAATPLRRLAEAEDFKGAAAFLCSDASRHMTGQMLVIDGGFSAC